MTVGDHVRLTDAERGSVLLAINLLARGLACDSKGDIELAQIQLKAVFGEATVEA